PDLALAVRSPAAHAASREPRAGVVVTGRELDHVGELDADRAGAARGGAIAELSAIVRAPTPHRRVGEQRAGVARAEHDLRRAEAALARAVDAVGPAHARVGGAHAGVAPRIRHGHPR